METQDFDPRALVAALVETITPSARAKGLVVSPLVYPNVPTRLGGDPVQLRQILSCLLSNAVTFTDNGQIVLSLTRDSETDTHFVLLCAISDTGVGIAPRLQEKLLRCVPCESDGSSGLVVAQKLVNDLGGALRVESTPTQGSTFWFSAHFRKIKSAGEGNRQATLPHPSRRVPPDSNARILVAEDDPVNRHATLHHLSLLGYRADVVENGREVLDALDSTLYDVVLLDCQMPIMNGYEATREIRCRENGARHTIIIALTSLATEANRAECLAAGMDDYLTKPIVNDELARCLKHWLRMSAAPATESASGFQGSEKFTAQLIPIFLDNAPKMIAVMQSALLAHNPQGIEQAAHTLKGSSALMNASALSRLCATLEDQGRRGAIESSQETLRQLEDEFEVVHNKLSLKLQKEQKSPIDL